MKHMLLLVAALVATAHALSVGDHFTRSFGLFDGMPTTATAALDAGWVQTSSSCDATLGYAYNMDQSGPTRSNPITLYYGANSALYGMAVTIQGDVANESFYRNVGEDAWTIEVSFRSSADACSTNAPTQGNLIGDQVLVNPRSRQYGTTMFSIPLNDTAASQLGMYSGACIKNMGRHWMHDTAAAPGEFTFNPATFMPVVTMYDQSGGARQGHINAIFFLSTDRQQTVLPPSNNDWDLTPIPTSLFCTNWCKSADCPTRFNQPFGKLWSTMHVWFTDQNTLSCPGGCSIQCCDNDTTDAFARVLLQR